MYARLTTFPLQPGSRGALEPIFDKFARLIAQQPGYRGLFFSFDEAGTQFVTLTQWASRGEAEAGPATLRDLAEREMGPLLSGRPNTQILEVYEPQ